MVQAIVKLQWIVCAIFLLTAHGEPLTLDSAQAEMCSTTLSTLVFQLCTGSVPLGDLRTENLPKIRGKRASIFSRERIKRQIVEECCSQPCSVAQLLAYCPDTW